MHQWDLSREPSDFEYKTLSYQNTTLLSPTLRLNYQICHFYMLRKLVVQELNPEEPLLQHFSILDVVIYNYSSLFCHLENLPKCLVSYPLRILF